MSLFRLLPDFQLSERSSHALPGGFQVFRQDPGFADGGHEVGVAGPPGHGVKMDVPRNPSACGLADIHAEIKTLGGVYALQGLLGALGQVDEFMGGFCGGVQRGGRDGQKA